MRRKFNLLLVFLLFLACYVKAQDNTPYARYGLGEITNTNFAALKGQGDISASFNSPNNLNFENPASFGFIKFTTFDIGGYAGSSHLQVGNQTASSGTGNPQYIALGFPILRNHWGLGIGLSQFSAANYNVVQYNDSTSSFLSNKNTFTGTGGINQVYIGTGYQLKNFALGIKAAYLFGTTSYTNTLNFVDTANAYNAMVQQTSSPRDILITGGVQYNYTGRDSSSFRQKGYRLTFGVNGNLSSNITARRDFLVERFTPSPRTDTIAPLVHDTIAQNLNQKGTIVIPMQFDIGITFSREHKYSIGAQFHYGQWSDYRSFGSPDLTANNWKASVGGEWIPAYDRNGVVNNYLGIVNYRLGAYYGTNYLKVDGKNLNTYGITFGFGLPMKRSFTRWESEAKKKGRPVKETHTGYLYNLNLSFEIGQLKSQQGSLFKQTYFMTTIGFSLSDIWFLKRKYD